MRYGQRKRSMKQNHQIPSNSTLVMFSGGLDSTAALVKTLNDGLSEHVHVHHLILDNVENRAKVESESVKLCLDWCRKNCKKQFSYSESLHSYDTYNNNFAWDIDRVYFEAGIICLNCPGIRRVIIGIESPDLADETFSLRHTRAIEIFRKFTDAKLEYPVAHLTKSDISKLILPELKQLTWSCRTPDLRGIFPQRCGKCKTCLEMLREGL